MAKIGMLFPEQKMAEAAQAIIDRMDEKPDIVCLKAITTPEAVVEARRATEAGAEILIARGHQAKQIKQNTGIPLVEIRFTAQEIGLFMIKAHQITGKNHPHVAIVAFENMLPDLTHVEELFDVRLSVLYIAQYQDAYEALLKMQEKPDVVIGGPFIREAAERLGYQSFYYQATEESIAEAIRTARSLSYAIDAEKRNAAQMETVFDVSLSGIIQIGSDRQIIAMNSFLEKETGVRREKACGKPLTEVFPQIREADLLKVLGGEAEFISTTAQIRGEAWMVQIASIAVDSDISGAVLSLRKISERWLTGPENSAEMRRRGYPASLRFKDILSENANMKDMLALAERYALSDSPVMINAATGTEAPEIAQAIHNNSIRSTGPFVSIDVRELPKDRQTELLFVRGPVIPGESGKESIFAKANHGTIYLDGIEELNADAQEMLLRTMRSLKTLQNDGLPLGSFDVRLIASSFIDLGVRMREGTFSEALFYRLKGLELKVPGLSERPEDLIREFLENMAYFSKKYSRIFQITEGGKRKIQEYPWPGNRTQLRSFCERLVLTAGKRQVDEVVISQLYQAMYPEVVRIDGTEKVVVYESPEGRKIRELLSRYNGNREKVASELGISTTTLWRHMKKYGIEPNYR